MGIQKNKEYIMGARTLDFADLESSNTQPSTLFSTAAQMPSYVDAAAFVSAKGSVAEAGDFFFNSTDDEVNYYDGSAWQVVATDAQITTLDGDLTTAEADIVALQNIDAGTRLDAIEGFPVFSASTDAGLSLPNGSQTDVTFEDVSIDTNSAYSGGEYTVPENGTYLIYFSILLDASASWGSGETFQCALRRDPLGGGSYAPLAFARDDQPGANSQANAQTVWLGNLTATDLIKVDAFQNSGSAITIEAGNGAAHNKLFIKRVA